MSEVVKADQYLNGVVPGAAFVVHLEDPADIANYTVEGNGTLFTVNSDLYITDAALTGVVSPDTTLSVIFNGVTLPVSATVAGGSGNTLLLVGYTQTGSTAAVTFSGKTLAGVAGTVLYDNKADNGSFRMTGTSTLSGVTFSGNSVSGSGGAIYAQNTWSVGEALFVNNLAPAYYGGAIHTNAASGTLKNVRFEGNTAKNGGAVNINSNAGAISISGGTFIGNHSVNAASQAAGAGAIYMQGGTLTIEDSFFRANTLAEGATTRGGAIYISGGSVSISGSTFRDHVITNRGGAIYNEKAAVFTVDKSLFSGNEADYGAGINHAASAATGTCTVTGSTFSNNTAATGGALANMFGTMTVGASEDGTWTYFYNNSGQGALRNNGSSAVMTVGNVWFEGNTGGALYNFQGKVTINGELVLATAADTIGRYNADSTYTIDCDEFLSDTTRIARVITTPAGAMNLKSMMTLDGGALTYTVASKDTTSGLFIMEEGLTLTPIVSPTGDVFQSAIGGTTYYSTGYSNLASAVNDAADTVILDGFTHSAGSYDPGKALTILGTDGAMFSGNTRGGYGGAMSLAYAATISGVTFSGNQGTRGGAIRAQQDLTLTNVIFDGNNATQGLGAGVLADASNTVNIFGGSFLNGGGSGIYDTDNVTVNAYGTVFFNNAGGSNGGGIHHRGTANLYGVTFSQNSSTNGAAIYANKAEAAVNIQAGTAGGKTVFADNTGAAAIYSIGGLTVSDAMFLGNTSNSSASAIRNGGTAKISGSTFSGNVGTVAVRNDSGTMTIGDVVFDGNVNGALNNQNGTMTIDGLITLKTAADALSNTGTIIVDGTAFITGSDPVAVKVIDAAAAINYGTVTVSGGDYGYFIADNDLYIANTDNVAAILTPSGTATIATDYRGSVYVGVAYSSLATALAGNEKVLMDDFTYSDGPFTNSEVRTILGGTNGAIFRNNVNSGNGGAISNSGTLTLAGVTFADNTGNRGGAINNSGVLDLTDVTFDGNTASYDKLASALLTSGTASVLRGVFLNGAGGAIYNNGANASLTLNDALFSNNDGGVYNGAAVQNNTTLVVQGSTFTANSSDKGTIYTNGNNGDITITGSTFIGNLGGYAVNTLKGVLSVRDTKFDGNAGGAVYMTEGTMTIRDSEFLTASDRIGTAADTVVNLTGTNTFNASVTGTGTYNLIDGTMIFGNTAGINIAGLTFSGSNAMTFNGSAAVNFIAGGGQDLTDVAITVGTGNLPGRGASFTIASGVTDMDDTITVAGVADPVKLGDDVVIGGGTYTYALDGTDFKVTQAWTWYNFVSAAPEGTESIVVNGETIALLNRYDTIGEAQSHLLAGGTIAIADLNVAGQVSTYYLQDRNGIVSGATFTGNSGNLGGVINVSENNSESTNTVIADSMFSGNTAIRRGGALFLKGKANDADTQFLISGSTFSGNTAETECGGAIYFQNEAGSLTIDGSDSAVVFDGNSDAEGGGALWVRQGAVEFTGEVKFLTATDQVYLRGDDASTSLSITNADLSLNADLIAGNGKTGEQFVQYADKISVRDSRIVFGNSEAITVSELSFAGSNSVTLNGAVVNFAGQDLSDVALTVNGSLGVGTVASGVTGFGGYTLTGTDNAALFLKLDGTDLVMYERAADLADGQTETNFVGGTANLITGGTVTAAFFGTRKNSFGSVRTVFTGGTVVNSMVAGALVQAKDTANAALDTVSVDIYDGVSLLGGTANGGMNYVAGYAYGRTEWTELPGSANYTVGEAVLNLSGSSISGNLYAGAHARKYAYTSVAATTVNVTGGIVEKLYGGGWAERGDKNITGGTAALSTVGTATVNISGGSINRLYAGGGNSLYGYTSVDTANLTISGGTVDFVFLGGRNINCFVGDTTLTITGDAQTLTRISGLNDCGVDNTTGTAALNVQTNVMLGYLDYVDRINIAEACTLNITELVLYDDISQELSVYLGTDGFDGTWDIFSATNARDIDTLAEAQFFVNNTACAMGGSVDIGGDSYRLDKSGLGITLSKIS